MMIGQMRKTYGKIKVNESVVDMNYNFEGIISLLDIV
jgi:hypothetical protein